jgi:hypothetical protein
MQGVMYHLNNLIAGEEANKATIFLLLLSAKVEDAKRKQIILVKGEPGAGKTTLMGIADLFNTKKIGRFTAHALDYTDLSHFDVLELQEVGFLDQEDQGVSTLKFLSPDDKGYTVACTVRDKETGKFIAEEHRIPPITLIASTTRVELDPQFERRAWPINPDESEQQTRAVRAFREQQQREENELLLGLRPQTSVMYSQRVLRTLIGSLEACRVVIPGCGALLRTLNTDRLRVRGDYTKLLNAIYVGAVLYFLLGAVAEATTDRVETLNATKHDFAHSTFFCMTLLRAPARGLLWWECRRQERIRTRSERNVFTLAPRTYRGIGSDH